MDEHKLGIVVLAIVGVIALSSMVLLHRNVTGMMGAPSYEQPAGNKPIYLQTSVFLPDFDMCGQFRCEYAGDGFYSDTEPAVTLGQDSWTGNLLCGCSDGRTFFIRSDRIEEEYPQ